MYNPEPNIIKRLTGRANYAILSANVSSGKFCKGRLISSASQIMSFHDFELIMKNPGLSAQHCHLITDGIRFPVSALSEPNEDLLAHLKEHFVSNAGSIVNSAELFSETVRNITEYLSWTLGVKSSATIHYNYVGLIKPPGYEADNTLIFQLSGRRKWKVWLPYINREHSNEELSELLSCEFILEQNDFLYLPAGYIHSLSCAQEQSLHLACSFNTRTDNSGSDLDRNQRVLATS